MDNGTITAISGNTLSLSHDDGTTSDRNVDTSATVTLNGTRAKFADLKVGDKVSLSGDPATSVTATR